MLYIPYAEDIDSLRFALSVIDEFDLSKNQPHFPAYPVFVFVVKSVYLIVQNVGVAFSIVGSIGVFLVAYSFLEINKIYNWVKQEWQMALTLIVSPLLFIMSTRYMADSLGLGFMSLACLFFIKAYKDSSFEKHFFVTTVLLAGIRLSFVPLLVVPALVLFFQSKNKVQNLLIGFLTLVVWLAPLILITGWKELIDVALFGTNGHFNEWGGSVATDPHYGLRFLRIIQFVWSDGIGLWWFDRHWILMPSSIVFLFVIAKSFKYTFPKELKILMFGFLVYGIWAYFFQNVLYKPRHILPLLLPVLFLFVIGLEKIKTGLKYSLLSVFIISQVYLTSNLAKQHQQKNALSKACDYVISISKEKDIVTSNNLIAYFLGQFETNEIMFLLPSDLPKSHTGRVITIGEVLPDRILIEEKKFYHNPYVNRMWYEVVVRVYE